MPRGLRSKNKSFYISKNNVFIKKIKHLDTRDFAAIRNEINATRKLKHKFVIQLLSYVTTIDAIWLSYPNHISDFHSITNDTYLDIIDVVYFFKQLLNGLAYIHKNRIIHCDLKLENIVLTQDYNLCIIDFDLSREFLDNNELYDDIIGTKEYEAPEMRDLNIASGWNASVDIWCCGIILEEFVYGTDYKQFLRGEVNDLDNLITLLKCKNPKDRIGHVQNMEYDIDLILNHTSLLIDATEASTKFRHKVMPKKFKSTINICVPIGIN
jgi:serine/threonine protein kinase